MLLSVYIRQWQRSKKKLFSLLHRRFFSFIFYHFRSNINEPLHITFVAFCQRWRKGKDRKMIRKWWHYIWMVPHSTLHSLGRTSTAKFLQKSLQIWTKYSRVSLTCFLSFCTLLMTSRAKPSSTIDWSGVTSNNIRICNSWLWIVNY